jgi:phage shock protein PspC (stress-responsive transcriptional regulator)
MKKTVNANLNGRAFTIDEDAYVMLENYLRNLKIHFRYAEGSNEIVADFEARIQELLSECVDKGVQVISLYQVEEVIARVGKPADFSEEGEKSENFSAPDSDSENFRNPAPEVKIPKRFFRNPNDRLLGGLCSGIAVYFGWEVTLVRVLAIILALLPSVGGIALIAYIVMWIITPSANNAERQLQMQGKPVTVENIGKVVAGGDNLNAKPVNDRQYGCVTAILIAIAVGLLLYFLLFSGLFSMMNVFDNDRMPNIVIHDKMFSPGKMFHPIRMIFTSFLGLPFLVLINVLIARIRGISAGLKAVICIIVSLLIIAGFFIFPILVDFIQHL